MHASHAAPSRDHYRPDIDGLRALSVIAVVLFHAEYALFSGGFVGVDVFFVISGFLITRLLVDEIRAGTFSFANFYMRRARRLFPALWFTAASSFVLAFLLFSPAHLERFGGAVFWTLASISNFYFWGEEGYFDAAATFKPLLHTWSLSVEEQFYMVWPALMLLLLRRLGYWIALAAIIVLAATSLYWSERMLSADALAAFFLTPFRLFELAIGALLVWIPRWQPRHALWLEFMLVSGLGLIAYAVFTFTDESRFPGLLALIPCGGAALAIYAGRAPRCGRLLSNPLAVHIGLISYSLYLIHWPLLVFYQYYTFEPLSALERLALVAAAIASAEFMFRYIERPLRHGHLKPGSLSPPAFGFACALSALVICLPAATAWANAGWAWRVKQTRPAAELQHSFTTWTPAWADAEPDFGGHFGGIVSVGSRKASARTALIIGDSHANHLRALADYIGKKYDVQFTIYVGFGCPPVFGTYKIYAINRTSMGKDRQESCRLQIERWRTLVASRDFDYVGLAARWAWLYESTQYGPYRMRQDYLVTDERADHDAESSRAIFIEHLARTVDEIRARGPQVLLFAQVPHQGKKLEDCSAVPGYLIEAASIGMRCGGIDRELALSRLAFTDEFFIELGKRDGVTAVIPSRYFCSAGQRHCTSFSGSAALYQDNNHLNHFGSMYYARRWEESPEFPFVDGAGPQAHTGAE